MASTGSAVFFAVALIAISILTLLLLRHYLRLRSTPAYLLVPVFLALALPCSIILLVPIDLASTGHDDSRGIALPERTVLVAWRISYWLTFLLTWWLLPLLGEYCDSGYRDTKNRVVYSLRENARYSLILLGVGTAGLVYFLLQNGLQGASIKGMVMALAYAWGLILAIALMGHGLVALPRRLYKNARPGSRLRALQIQAPKVKDKLDEATESLEALENTVILLKSRKTGIGRDLESWIDELADTTAPAETRAPSVAAIQSTDSSVPAVVTERYLADLTRKLKRARHKKVRFVNEWTTLCQQAKDCQTILDAASSKRLDFSQVSPEGRSILSRLSFITPSMRYQLYSTILPVVQLGLAGFLALASMMLIWSEVIRSFLPRISAVSLTVVHHAGSEHGEVGVAGQIIAAAWLLYMDACALYAISDVKVWGNRALVKRNTYAESACWYSLQVAKLTVPLSYNFITMLRRSVYEDTSFYKFLGQLIDLTPLGQGFSNFFPCFLLIPVLATLFNLYGKVKSVFGFGILDDDSDDNPTGFGTGGWREGRALIERELQVREDNAMGLPTRGVSLDIERGAGRSASAATTRSFPRELQRETFGSSHIQEANRQFNSITNQEELRDEDDNSARHFYQDFTERVRNTFDTIDRPDWMRNGLKAPKWMQNGAGEDDGGSALKKWFGGRAEGGRLRL